MKKALDKQSEAYAHIALEFGTPFEKHKRDFTQGAEWAINEVKKRLVELCPEIKDDKYTNPFLYRDVMNWYKEINEPKP